MWDGQAATLMEFCHDIQQDSLALVNSCTICVVQAMDVDAERLPVPVEHLQALIMEFDIYPDSP